MKKQAKQPAPLTTDLPLILYPLWKEKQKQKQKQKNISRECRLLVPVFSATCLSSMARSNTSTNKKRKT
jgi:hypothetical protein